MALRHLIIAAMLTGFVPSVMPIIPMDKAEAAQTVKKKKKKVIERKQEPRVKKNFRGPMARRTQCRLDGRLPLLLRRLWQATRLLPTLRPRFPDVGLVTAAGGVLAGICNRIHC